MTPSDREQDGKSSALLGPDVILKVDSRISTGSYAAVVGPASEFSNGQALVEGQVVLSTVRAFERRLVALVDGRRTVKELIQLSGLSEAQAKRHLASLCRRRVLIAADAPHAPDPAAPLETESGESRKTPSWTAKARPVRSDQDKTVVGVRVSDLEAARKADGGVTPTTTASGTPSQRFPTDDADTERVVVGRLTGPRHPTPTPTADKGKSGSGPNNSFKPGVTAFWIPSPVEEAAAALETTPRPPRSSSPGHGTIVVTGAQAGSGPHPVSPWTPSGQASGPVATGASTEKGAFRLGGYEIATRLSQTAGSSIYVCRRAGGAPGSRLFTLKVVRQRSSQAAEVIQAFRREARVGALLNHPNLQTVVDVGSYHEQPFLILDYIEGVSLAELMAGKDRMPVPVLVSILLDVLQGLRSAHDVVDEQGMRLGLVHGDVTPRNILVGIDGKARLMDFGSARFGSDARALEVAPLPNTQPGFLSPEQLCDAPLDGRTDLFSLGVVMWSALTAQPLFAAESHDQTVANIFRKRIQPPSELGAPSALDEILVRALSRSPEGRYNNASEMAEALTRAAANADVSGSPLDVGRWMRREFAETVLDRQRRIQAVFGGPPVVGLGATPPSPPPAQVQAASVSVEAPQRALAVMPLQPGLIARDQRPARKEEAGGEGVGRRAFARRAPAAPTTEKTIPGVRSPRHIQWRVVLVSGLIAFPFILALVYAASSPLMRYLYPAEPERVPAARVRRPVPPVPQEDPALAVPAPVGAVGAPAGAGAPPKSP